MSACMPPRYEENVSPLTGPDTDSAQTDTDFLNDPAAASFSFVRPAVEYRALPEDFKHQLSRRTGGNLTWHDGRGQKSAGGRAVKLLQQPGTGALQHSPASEQTSSRALLRLNGEKLQRMGLEPLEGYRSHIPGRESNCEEARDEELHYPQSHSAVQTDSIHGFQQPVPVPRSRAESRPAPTGNRVSVSLCPEESSFFRLQQSDEAEPPLLRTGSRTVYTAGRPPWYNEYGAQSKEAFVIEEQSLAASNDYSFDHPAAFHFQLQVATLRKLKQGKSLKILVHDFSSHARQRDWPVRSYLKCFADKELLELLDMKIFVDTDSDIRLVRRLRRDITERGRDIEGVIKQYHKFVKPAFEQNIEPAMRLADIVVSRGGGNMVAIHLIVQHVHSQLEERELRVRALLASAQQNQTQSSPQVRGLHTITRNKETSRGEFIFYSKRLMWLLIEHALTFLPAQVCVVQTPQGEEYEGPPITGVSVLRAGETMEPALRAVCKDVRIGKILIQTNVDSGEPELHYLRLPKDISEDHVILMDSSASTGAAAMMAVRVLLDHEVQEEQVVLVSLLMAELGVHSVTYAFPQVRIITSAVDKSLDDFLQVLPGL
ncbi:hypothetical protein JOQ06_022562, partial [Pogonophryne albipinna]